MSGKKIDYTAVSDEVLRTFIRNHLNKQGHNYRQICEVFNIPSDRSKRLLNDLKRYRYAHITDWIYDERAVAYIPIFVKGPGYNVPKPQSLYKTMSIERLSQHILTLLPNSKGNLSRQLQIPLSTIHKVLIHMVDSHMVVRGYCETGKTKIIYHDINKYDGVIYEGDSEGRESLAPINVKGKLGSSASGLTLPWKGYNVRQDNRPVYTEWRHAIN